MANIRRLKKQLMYASSFLLASSLYANHPCEGMKFVRSKNRFLSFVVLAETAYILNDKDPNGVATTFKEELKKAYAQAVDSIQKMIKDGTPNKKDNGNSEALTNQTHDNDADDDDDDDDN